MKKRWILLVASVMCLFTLTGCGQDQVTVSGDEFEEIMEDNGFEVDEGEVDSSLDVDEELISETYVAYDGESLYWKGVQFFEADSIRDAKKIYKQICRTEKDGYKEYKKTVDEYGDGDYISDYEEESDSDVGNCEWWLEQESNTDDDEFSAMTKVVWTEERVVWIQVYGEHPKAMVKDIMRDID